MHNNYYLIRQVIICLKKELSNASLNQCFSQNKNELVLQFERQGRKQFNIIAHLDPQFTCLSFPEEHHKAKKNTVDIFSTLAGEKVIDVEGYKNERAFNVKLTNQYSLLFKLFGHQANILLLSSNKVIDIFRKNLKADLNLDTTFLARNIDQSKAAVLKVLPDIKSVYPTLDKKTRVQLELAMVNLDVNKSYSKLKAVIKQLEKPSEYYIVKEGENLRLSLLPSPNILLKYKYPLKAITQFFILYKKEYYYQREQKWQLKSLEQKLKKTTAYLKKIQEKKNKLENNTSYKNMADIIMANLHLINEHTSTIELDDFYTGKPIKIKLNPRLSAQKNAEKYYNKSKNIGIEIAKLAETIKAKELQLVAIKKDLELVKSSATIRELQKHGKTSKTTSAKEDIPFKQFILDDFTILVGKNAKNNDLLTLKYAKKDDLFFHAKDVSGSHVILKKMSGRVVPVYILEKVAAIAAYYSKRKTDSLCPVGYTPKKYVRKPKGSPPGLVLVEREKVILVKPALPN